VKPEERRFKLNRFYLLEKNGPGAHFCALFSFW
jgi:hypothetical protein